MAFLAKIQTKLRYKTETEVLTGREWQQILRSQVSFTEHWVRGRASGEYSRARWVKCADKRVHEWESRFVSVT